MNPNDINVNDITEVKPSLINTNSKTVEFVEELKQDSNYIFKVQENFILKEKKEKELVFEYPNGKEYIVDLDEFNGNRFTVTKLSYSKNSLSADEFKNLNCKIDNSLEIDKNKASAILEVGMYYNLSDEVQAKFKGVFGNDIHFENNDNSHLEISTEQFYKNISLIEIPNKISEDKKISPELFYDILSKEGKEELKKQINTGSKNNIKKFINSIKKLSKTLENGIDDKELIEGLLDALTKTKSNKKRIMSDETTKKPFNPSVIENGDLISVPSNVPGEFLKGTVTTINEDNYVIDSKKEGAITVPKEGAMKFYPKQKYDIREVSVLFDNLKQLKFKDLSAKDKGVLLRGGETSVIKGKGMSTNDKGEKVLSDKIFRTFVSKNAEGKLQLDRVWGAEKLDLDKTKIYGKPLKDILNKEQLKDIGSKEVVVELENKEGVKFNRVLFTDKDLNIVRSKPLTKSQKEDLSKKIEEVKNKKPEVAEKKKTGKKI